MGFTYGNFVEAERTSPDLKVTAYSGTDIPDALKAVQSGFALPNVTTRDSEAQSRISMGGFTTAKSVKYAADLAMQALQFFSYYFGALPFKALSVTEQPVAVFTSSSPYLISLSYDTFLDQTTRNSLHFEDSGLMRDYYRVGVFKELSKQWCNHLVGVKTYHDRWLTEGIADFAGSVYLRQFDPKSLNDFYDIRRTWLFSKIRLGYRVMDIGPVWLNPQLNEYNGENNYTVVNYKGSYIMEMLRMLMYDPKLKAHDGRFIAMMHDFYSTFAGKNASTEDFRKDS